MIAKARDFDPSFFAGLYQGHRPVNFDLFSVNDDFAQIRHGVPYLFPIASIAAKVKTRWVAF
jgi:hypothetical protein